MIDNILFHAFKHHFQYNIEWLKENLGQWNNENNRLLKSIGSSQLDYYLGSLPVHNIKSEISEYLYFRKLDAKEEYEKWISKNKGFREITLSDKSVWTLRFVDKNNFVHIHPSRYSPNTIRIKANILKTVLCVLLFQDNLKIMPDIQLINKCRIEYLVLSPLRVNNIHYELEKGFNFFNNQIKF